MTADELIFFVNGRKVSRSLLLVWSPWSLGGDVSPLEEEVLVVSLWSIPSYLLSSFSLLQKCCYILVTLGKKTFLGLVDRQDTQEAKEFRGGRGEERLL